MPRVTHRILDLVIRRYLSKKKSCSSDVEVQTFSAVARKTELIHNFKLTAIIFGILLESCKRRTKRLLSVVSRLQKRRV